MTHSLRKQLRDAEARRRNAARDVADLLGQILAGAGLELIRAEHLADDQWTLVMRLEADAESPVADVKDDQERLARESAGEVVEEDMVRESETVEAPETSTPTPTESAQPVFIAPAADLATDEETEVATPTFEDRIASTAHDVEETDAPTSAVSEGEVPFLAPLPDLPALRDDDSISIAPEGPFNDVEREAEAPLEGKPFELPPLPPLSVLDDKDDIVPFPNTPSTKPVVQEKEEKEPASLATEDLGASLPPLPSLDPTSSAEPADSGPADLETLLRNGRSELRVKQTPQNGRRKNPFKQSSTDPRKRAERLARTLVSDMIAYAPDKHAGALRKGLDAIRTEFADEIETARFEYYAQVDESLPDREAIFRKAVNDLLGNGQPVLADE